MAITFTSFNEDIKLIDSKLSESVVKQYISLVDDIISTKYGYIVKSDRSKLDIDEYTKNLELCLVNPISFEININTFLNNYGFEKIEIKKETSIKDLYTESTEELKKKLLTKNESYGKVVDELLGEINNLKDKQNEIDEQLTSFEVQRNKLDEQIKSLTKISDMYDSVIDNLRIKAGNLEDEQSKMDDIIEQIDKLGKTIKSTIDN